MINILSPLHALPYFSGYLCGVLTVDTNLSSSTVILSDSRGRHIKTKLSADSGYYIFTGLDTNLLYTITGVDNSGLVQPYSYTCKPLNDMSIYEQYMFEKQIHTTEFITPPLNMYNLPLTTKMSQSSPHGTSSFTGFIEGVDEPYTVESIDIVFDGYTVCRPVIDNSYSITNINIENILCLIYNDKTEPFDKSQYSQPHVKGYITGSVNQNCEGVDFMIRCYREDGFFVGDYELVDNSYTIPNLNVNSSYDILLHDRNSSVETMVNSRRIPTAY